MATESLPSRLKQLILTGVNEAAKQIRTTVPGYVLAFDAERQYANIQVGIQQLDMSGRTYTPPPIVNCPVCIYGAAGGVVETKIEKGDEVLIHFSMRCIDGWRNQGGVAPLVSVERFRFADAFAVLAPRSSKNVITDYANDGIRIRALDGSRYVWLKDDGTIEVASTGSTFVNGAEITSGGNVITKEGADLDEVKAKLNELITRFNGHQHTGNQGSPTPLIGDPVDPL